MKNDSSNTFHDELLKALIARGRISADILNLPPKERRRLVPIGGQPEQKAETYRDISKDGSPSPPVNCSERLHICNAVCCKLGILLSKEEVAQGIVQWEPEKPYYIRHEADGHCCHINRADLRCGIYSDRPQPCRDYSCARDPRIWVDFEAMKLNHEWIKAALGEKSVPMNPDGQP